MDDQIEELVLLLLYLTSWEEDIRVPDRDTMKMVDKKLARSWKGYPFEVLDSLTEKGFIAGRRRAKSIYLTEEGIKKAEELKKEYLGT